MGNRRIALAQPPQSPYKHIMVEENHSTHNTNPQEPPLWEVKVYDYNNPAHRPLIKQFQHLRQANINDPIRGTRITFPLEHPKDEHSYFVLATGTIAGERKLL